MESTGNLHFDDQCRQLLFQRSSFHYSSFEKGCRMKASSTRQENIVAYRYKWNLVRRVAAHTKPVPQALTPGGRGGSKRESFWSVKLLIFLAGQTLPAMPGSLSSRQAASQTQARLVSRLCVDRLPVVDWVKKPVYFLGKVFGGCVEINTVFINPDIYISCFSSWRYVTNKHYEQRHFLQERIKRRLFSLSCHHHHHH